MLSKKVSRSGARRLILSVTSLMLITGAVWSDTASAQSIQHCRGKMCFADTLHNPLHVAFPKANKKNTYASIPFFTRTTAGRGKNLGVGEHRLNLSKIRSLNFKSGGLTAKLGGIVGSCSTKIFSVSSGRVRVPLACISSTSLASQARLSLKKGNLNKKTTTLSDADINTLISRLIKLLLEKTTPVNNGVVDNPVTQLVNVVVDETPPSSKETSSKGPDNTQRETRNKGVTKECIERSRVEGRLKRETEFPDLLCLAVCKESHIFTESGECVDDCGGCFSPDPLSLCDTPPSVKFSPGSCRNVGKKKEGEPSYPLPWQPGPRDEIISPWIPVPDTNPVPVPIRKPVEKPVEPRVPERVATASPPPAYGGREPAGTIFLNSAVERTAATNPVEYNRCSSDVVLQNGACKFGANGSDCYAASVNDPKVGDSSTVCINQMGTIMPYKPCESGLNQGRNCAQGQVRDGRCSQDELPNHPYITSFGPGSGGQGVYCCTSPTIGGGNGPASGVSCIPLNGEDKWDHSDTPVETGIKTPEKPIDPSKLQPNQRRDCDLGGQAPALKNCGETAENPFGNGTCGFNGEFGATKAMSAPVVNDARCCSGQAAYVEHIIGGNGPEGRKGEHANYRCCGAEGEPSC